MESIIHKREQVINDFKTKNIKYPDYYKLNLTATFINAHGYKDNNYDHDYLNQLYNILISNQNLIKIIRIIPINERKPINIKSYLIYIYTDDFKLYTIDKDNQIIEHQFTFSHNLRELSFLNINVTKIDYRDYLNDDQKLERIYTKIYKYYREYTNNKLFKLKYMYSKIDIYADYLKQLKWDILKHYILTSNYSMMSDMIEDEITNLSVLINLINYQNDNTIKGLDNTVRQWINKYLEWYNGEGKEILNRCKSIFYVYNHTDIVSDYNDYIDPKCYTYTCIIEEYGIYQKTNISRLTVDKIELLIKQIYYTLAQLLLSDNIHSDNDKINKLKYLEIAGNYKNAKELKRKLFFEYLGYEMGQEPDIELDDKGIVMAYKIAKLIRK